MLVKKISRTYSKSINSNTYGGPESWIRLEATYEAEVESTDDPKKCSEYLFQLAKDDVLAGSNEIIGKIKAAIAPKTVAPTEGGNFPAGSTAGTGNGTYVRRAL